MLPLKLNDASQAKIDNYIPGAILQQPVQVRMLRKLEIFTRR